MLHYATKSNKKERHGLRASDRGKALVVGHSNRNEKVRLRCIPGSGDGISGWLKMLLELRLELKPQEGYTTWRGFVFNRSKCPQFSDRHITSTFRDLDSDKSRNWCKGDSGEETSRSHHQVGWLPRKTLDRLLSQTRSSEKLETVRVLMRVIGELEHERGRPSLGSSL